MKYKGIMSGYKFMSALLISVMFFYMIFANAAFADEKPEIFIQLGHPDVVDSVAFSPNGSQVLSGSNDKTLKLWDVATGREIRTFTGHSQWIYSVAFSPDGRQALSGSGDQTLKLWDVDSRPGDPDLHGAFK